MNRPANYNTKQREAVLAYIASLAGNHVTAAEIVRYFQQEDISIGRTTVYRLLDKLTEGGKIRRYTMEGISGACFQYMNKEEACQEHFHLKCENCGELLHLECEAMHEIQEHILDKHAFQVNAMRTVLYGKCDTCLHQT